MLIRSYSVSFSLLVGIPSGQQPKTKYNNNTVDRAISSLRVLGRNNAVDRATSSLRVLGRCLGSG